MHHSVRVTLLLSCVLLSSGCEENEVNLGLAAGAGIDAFKAVTLSDSSVSTMAIDAAKFSDSQNKVAPADSAYARRLSRLANQYAAPQGAKENLNFNFKVYLDPAINAFAMADGSIRFYSGLMDVMMDDELLFIMGHEMGHVVHDHSHNQIRLSYASRALRKGVASLNNEVGELARSELGGLVEGLVNAQYSQQEEKESDDYGLAFLQRIEIEPMAAVSALQKLADMNGGNHSFLSSHPNPEKRYERLLTKIR